MSFVQSLSSSMGLAVGDPAFWLPLLLILIVTLLLLCFVLLDGIASGVGILLPWFKGNDRQDLLALMSKWSRINEVWLPLLLLVSMGAFPFVWSAISENLYLPLLLLVSGLLGRSFSQRLLASQPKASYGWVYTLASVLSILGFGLLTAEYATGQRFYISLGVFVLLITLSTLGGFALLGASWLILLIRDPIRQKVARLAAFCARWSAAGMVGLSFTLALANPAIFYRWTHGDNLSVALPWWLVMLLGFVWLDRCLRRLAVGEARRCRFMVLPLTGLLFVLMFAGVVYSFFPFLVLDELTVWDAAAPLESLYAVAAVTAALLPVVLIWQVLALWRFVRQCRRSSAP